MIPFAASPWALPPCPHQGMGVPYQGLETLFQHMGVNLGGADVGVSQHLLERAQVCAVGEQVAGERVAEHVRRDPACF